MTYSLLNKYIQRSPSDATDISPLSDLEPLEDLGSFGWLRGVRDRAVMLELRKKDGNILAVGYAWLDKAEFDPSTGITLHIGSQTITLRGRHLNTETRPHVRLFQGITRHRVPWIQEADEPSAMESQGQGTLVEEIEW